MGIRNNANASPPMIRSMSTSTSGGISRTAAGVPIGMALEHIFRELDDGHPAASRHMDGTDDLHVSLRNIMYTDPPISVAPITLPHTQLKEGKNFESVAVITEEVMSSHRRICQRRWRHVS
jgi:hypothetical protein